jgi:hypothetical protein
VTSKFHAINDVSDLAEEFSRWTKTYPRHLPYSDPSDDRLPWDYHYLKRQSIRSQGRYKRLNSTLHSIVSLFFGENVTITVPDVSMKYSQEPIIGSFRELEEFDKNGTLFVLSAMYAFLRLLQFLYKFLRGRPFW